MTTDIGRYGLRNFAMPAEKTGLLPARVSAAHKGRFALVCEHGSVWARLKAAAYYNNRDILLPAVGDFVLIRYNPEGESLIVETLPRKSALERLDPSSSGHAAQVVAANFDYVFILISLNKEFNLKKLERFLICAWQSGAVPAVILTKADLVEDSSAFVREAEKHAPGACVFATSATTGEGFDKLGDFLGEGRTIVLLGSSGVGKSSFVNALAGETLMDVGEIREDDARGRHTTTHRQLLLLPSGVLVIDTPGIRSVGMWEAEAGLSGVYGEEEALEAQCRFSNCTHTNEPGCAVIGAIRDGTLSQKRWQNYQKLKKEAVVRQRKDFLKQKSAQAQNKYSRSAQKKGSRYDEV